MHAAGASLRSAPRPPAWRPGPARRAHSPSVPRRLKTDASLSLAGAPARPPAARHAHAVHPGCAGSAYPPRALTPLAPCDCTAARGSAGHGRMPSTRRTPAGTRAGRTPRSAAPPTGAPRTRRLLAPRPGVRYLLLIGPPASHTRARLQEGPPVASGGPSVFLGARGRGLHRRTLPLSTSRPNPSRGVVLKSGNSRRPMTRNLRFLVTINRWWTNWATSPSRSAAPTSSSNWWRVAARRAACC